MVKMGNWPHVSDIYTHTYVYIYTYIKYIKYDILQKSCYKQYVTTRDILCRTERQKVKYRIIWTMFYKVYYICMYIRIYIRTVCYNCIYNSEVIQEHIGSQRTKPSRKFPLIPKGSSIPDPAPKFMDGVIFRLHHPEWNVPSFNQFPQNTHSHKQITCWLNSLKTRGCQFPGRRCTAVHLSFHHFSWSPLHTASPLPVLSPLS